MWKASVGMKPVLPPKPTPEDDWETDPDFVNDIGEKASRWGAKTIQDSGHQGSFSLDNLRNEVIKSDVAAKDKRLATMPKPSQGYGGKFGVETDRVDKCAVDFKYEGKVAPHVSQKDYSKGFGGVYGVDEGRQDKSAFGYGEKGDLAKHESQKDYSKGFGGQYGVQTDRQDRSAVGWSHRENLEQHESQKDYKKGFGGQFGVQTDRQDKSATGWGHHENLQQHESQIDYKKGFGGQFGVQTDRQDKSASKWDEKEKVQPHESQTDYKKGFGGQFGVQTDRQDKSALGWNVTERKTNVSKITPIEISPEKGRASNLRSKFEQMANQQQDDKVKEERERRKREDEDLRKRQIEAEKMRQEKIDSEWAERKPGEKEDDDIGKNPTSSKTRPSNGIRLPIASSEAPPKPVRTSTEASEFPSSIIGQSIMHSTSPITTHPTAPVQETNSGINATAVQPPISALVSRRRRNSSTTDNEDDWGDDFARKSNISNSIPPSDPVILTQTQPKDITVDVLGSDLEAQTHHIQATQNVHDYVHERYDYVPEEITTNPQPVSVSQYEEPPYEAIIQPPSAPVAANGDSQKNLTATALYFYEKQDDDEISFDVGDLIIEIEQIDVGWWRGICRNAYGLFPANYVQLNN